ncbi:MAG: M61 family metallopeptidase [Bacteroidetes bacterium]|nr:M61 family metallopeptidase [Bacteroidota bacterium]
MKYIFSYSEPQKHLIDIEFIAENINGDETTIQLPAWRPGRYELGNFAKNVKQFFPQDKKGNPLTFHKATKDCWKINTKNVSTLHIKYNYYAVELNAGSSFLDDKQLYVNPVNCCVYIPERMNEACEVELKIPNNYIVATSLKPDTPPIPIAIGTSPQESTFMRKTLPFGERWRGVASNYHELADSPFIASPTIQHNLFVMDGVEFNLWFQGECKPNWSKLINDFFIFINEQFVTMKGVTPTNEYHFLFHILPYRFYHGVEHLSSTVIALGPSYEVMRGDSFLELLSISSHELFHAWNIKAIRPAEMHPYDYTKENYSRLGFVCEGVTTYYGDFFLYRSGIYSDFEVNRALSKHLQNHFDNFGRYNLSVADSSFDSWLDGYTEIVPHRKTSIYSEGCLIAFMTDLMIRKYSNNERSLDDVMLHLYNEFAKKEKGYTEVDYKTTVEQMTGHSFDEFFRNYVYKANSYENALIECIEYVGFQLHTSFSKKYHERHYGIKVSETTPATKVIAIYPNSVAEKAGIQLNDEIISINGYQIKNNLTEWSKYLGQPAFANASEDKSEVTLIVNNTGKTRIITFTPSSEDYYKTYFIQKTSTPTEAQKKNFNAWSKRKF